MQWVNIIQNHIIITREYLSKDNFKSFACVHQCEEGPSSKGEDPDSWLHPSLILGVAELRAVYVRPCCVRSIRPWGYSCTDIPEISEDEPP